MKQIVITLIFLNSILSCAQTILNSERILSKIDSSMVFGTSLDGDFSTGNINLVNATFSSQLGKKIDNHLIRLIYNYTYTSENKEILSDVNRRLCARRSSTAHHHDVILLPQSLFRIFGIGHLHLLRQLYDELCSVVWFPCADKQHVHRTQTGG